MKAILCTRYDSFDGLRIEEVKKPSIKENELLIRIMASTVASGDSVVRRASNPFVKLVFGLSKPRNPILGTDLAGIVEAVGGKVTTFKVGDRVVASTGMKFGGHAEYIALDQTVAIAKIPEEQAFKDAVTLPFGGNAGLHYLNKMQKGNGKRLLIYGASGAVGSSTVQLAKIYGFHVTAVCSARNMDLVRSLGADIVRDYTSADWKEELGCFDHIFDAVGKTDKKQWKNHLNTNGTFYTIAKGFVKENAPNLDLLLSLAQKKQLKPVIDKIYSMEQIVDAYKLVESGRKRGNVVLDFQ
ncbi:MULTISPECIES: NAD(P)-dependent alcohol dehydrogenase [unclassified Enterococcus]|uniref:NAD(P)-dependent alcohol dehydrogenase n=1 Tax=unclassified Enterococcus TaxID=2608891 RepID=UPI001CE10D39|nr:MULTISPECIES: NAD(P)-dependent alcohol dehydrogenase [unclassified Enterococcus]MCA5014429.1 NAD(P)-dependent alcohol dehydrogenase [Enterococcus sp. S23]MCA5017457.1 NAD(P)-dependent alcohol dehydrogenase [Enterococcus sp. S22(2020)]